MMGKPTGTGPELGELMDYEQQLWSQPATYLGPLHVCNTCVAWSVCGASSSGLRTCPGYLGCLGNIFPVLVWLPCPDLTQWGGTRSCLSQMCQVFRRQWEVCPLSMETVEEWMGRRYMGDRLEGGFKEEKLWPVYKINEKFFNEKEKKNFSHLQNIKANLETQQL